MTITVLRLSREEKNQIMYDALVYLKRLEWKSLVFSVEPLRTNSDIKTIVCKKITLGKRYQKRLYFVSTDRSKPPIFLKHPTIPRKLRTDGGVFSGETDPLQVAFNVVEFLSEDGTFWRLIPRMLMLLSIEKRKKWYAEEFG